MSANRLRIFCTSLFCVIVLSSELLASDTNSPTQEVVGTLTLKPLENVPFVEFRKDDTEIAALRKALQKLPPDEADLPALTDLEKLHDQMASTPSHVCSYRDALSPREILFERLVKLFKTNAGAAFYRKAFDKATKPKFEDARNTADLLYQLQLALLYRPLWAAREVQQDAIVVLQKHGFSFLATQMGKAYLSDLRRFVRLASLTDEQIWQIQYTFASLAVAYANQGHEKTAKEILDFVFHPKSAIDRHNDDEFSFIPGSREITREEFEGFLTKRANAIGLPAPPEENSLKRRLYSPHKSMRQLSQLILSYFSKAELERDFPTVFGRQAGLLTKLLTPSASPLTCMAFDPLYFVLSEGTSVDLAIVIIIYGKVQRDKMVLKHGVRWLPEMEVFAKQNSFGEKAMVSLRAFRALGKRSIPHLSAILADRKVWRITNAFGEVKTPVAFLTEAVRTIGQLRPRDEAILKQLEKTFYKFPSYYYGYAGRVEIALIFIDAGRTEFVKGRLRDGGTMVQINIVEALSRLEPSKLKPFEDALNRAAFDLYDPTLRLKACEALAILAPRSLKSLETLRKVSRGDPLEENRRLVRKIFKRSRTKALPYLLELAQSSYEKNSALAKKILKGFVATFRLP